MLAISELGAQRWAYKGLCETQRGRSSQVPSLPPLAEHGQSGCATNVSDVLAWMDLRGTGMSWRDLTSFVCEPLMACLERGKGEALVALLS